MKQLKLFISSFKSLRKSFLYVLVLDAAVALAAVFGVNLWAANMKSATAAAAKSMAAIQEMQLGAVTGTDAAQHIAQLKSFYIGLVLKPILLLLLLFLVWMVTRAIVWHLVLNKKFHVGFLKRFTLLNLIWLLPNVFVWVVFLLVVSFLGRFMQAWALSQTGFLAYAIPVAVMFLVVIPIAVFLVNLTNLLLLYYTRTHKISKSLAEMFTFTFTKTHRLIIPYYLISFVFLVLSIILLPLRYHMTAYLYASVIGMAAILAWMKFYLVGLEKSLATHQ